MQARSRFMAEIEVDKSGLLGGVLLGEGI